MDLVMCLAELDDDLWHIRDRSVTENNTAACGREVIGDIAEQLLIDAPRACPSCVRAVKSLILN